MKRRARRAVKSFRNKCSDIKSAATNLLERSASQYDYPRSSARVTSTVMKYFSEIMLFTLFYFFRSHHVHLIVVMMILMYLGQYQMMSMNYI